MPMTKDQLLVEAKALDPGQRAELVEDLRQIIGDDELTQELRAELRRRVEALDRGEVTLIPGEQVMRELHERLRRR
jgi:putative addiction module component (TIGR02574 family)